jgi:nucleoside-diphosphate-sugar epimerase
MQIAEMAAKHTGAKIAVKPSNDPRSYRVSSEKLLATGFKPSKSVEHAIEEIVSAYKNGKLKDEDRFYNLKWMEQIGLASK